MNILNLPHLLINSLKRLRLTVYLHHQIKMVDIKIGDRILCLIPGLNSTQEAEVTDVLETCVQIKYDKAPFSNLLTIDKTCVIEKVNGFFKSLT